MSPIVFSDAAPYYGLCLWYLYSVQDGFITATDLKAFFTTFQKKLTDEDIKSIINDGDENGDDKIDMSEFMKIMNKN